MTHADYLALEAQSETKHEYLRARSDSLREYVLVAQKERRIEVFREVLRRPRRRNRCSQLTRQQGRSARAAAPAIGSGLAARLT
jgi:hypothetical protein